MPSSMTLISRAGKGAGAGSGVGCAMPTGSRSGLGVATATVGKSGTAVAAVLAQLVASMQGINKRVNHSLFTADGSALRGAYDPDTSSLGAKSLKIGAQDNQHVHSS